MSLCLIIFITFFSKDVQTFGDKVRLLDKCLNGPTIHFMQSMFTSLFSNRFATEFGPSYDGIVVHSFKNKVGEYLERMARYVLLQEQGRGVPRAYGQVCTPSNLHTN